ncbi:MAG: hypothetical protein ACK5PI_10215, partial [Acetobacteraceae bacterium]
MTGTRNRVTVRRAHAADADGIAAIHAEVWRNAYAGILPGAYLARLSPLRLALSYRRALARDEVPAEVAVEMRGGVFGQRPDEGAVAGIGGEMRG